MSPNDVFIIGAGPAGIAAAIQLKRSGLNPIIFEKKSIGGLLNNANLVENYPGFPGGISGRELVSLFEEQLESLGIEIIYETVELLEYNNDLFALRSVSKKIEAKTVIIASGTSPKQIRNISISDKIKNKIYYEICDLLDLQNQNIVIIGAGDAAFDYALNLSKKNKNNKVTILNRGENIKCLRLLYDRVKKAEAQKLINYLTQTEVLEINASPDNQLQLKCRNNNDDVDIRADYVIFAIGREVSLLYLGENLKKRKEELEQQGWLYLIGDVKNRIYRQTSIAVGEGVLTAMKIERKLNEK